MVSWSLPTLSLGLLLILGICAAYMMIQVFQLAGAKWGLLFVLTPLLYAGLSRYVGAAAAGLLMGGAQVYIVNKFWKEIGRVFVYEIICWAGVLGVTTKTDGWRAALLPPQISAPTVQVVQASSGPRAADLYVGTPRGRVWYAMTGAGAGTPLIVVHGVPGGTSNYLKPMDALGDDRPVIRYDQFGAGHSLGSVDTTAAWIAASVAELDSLRASLGYEKVHLLGHGTGATIAFEYARAHAAHVASLTLASPMLSGPEWIRHSADLIATLPDSAQAAIAQRTADQDFDAMDFGEARDQFNAQFLSLHPNEVERDSMAKALNTGVHTYQWGPTDLLLTGQLRTYDARKVLRRLAVPTLYTVGEFDIAGPDLVKRFATATRGSRYEVIPGAAHYVTWDNPDAFISVVRDFLRGVDGSAQ
jgi:proline iminopeptidase